MPTANVGLSDYLAAFAEQEVTSAGYASQSEMARQALCLLHQKMAVEQEKLEKLRRAVVMGVEDWRQGRTDDRPIDEILDEIDKQE